MNQLLPSLVFWIFAGLTLLGGIAVVALRNPVSSAMAVVTCFIGLAGLFITLSAFFVGIIQILVYTGAIMVLFLFIIMLLDLKVEKGKARSLAGIAAGLSLVAAFVIQLIGVLGANPDMEMSDAPLNKQRMVESAQLLTKESDDNPHPVGADSAIVKSLKEGRLPDVHLVGHKLFTEYNFPLQMLGVLLLVATVGVVSLSKKKSA